MSTTRSHGRGRGSNKPNGPLRKPGQLLTENNISQNDEKPPAIVQKTETTANIASKSGPEQIAQDAGIGRTVGKSEEKNKNRNENDVLLRAVNNPVFVPRGCKEETSTVKSSFSASAVNAPEFVPGQGFGKCETRLRDSGRILEIVEFVNNKLKQLTEDPGLLDELSVSMANILSAYITVEDEMRTVSNILFQKCISEQNFQYTGSKLANYLDKYLVPKTTEKLLFRGEFLKRCKSENDRFKDIILTDHERAYNVALFLGELLMNYKDINGQSIEKFLIVVSNIINQLLACIHVPKLLICAGKLLKMTGSALNPTDGLFVTVMELANSRHIDRTAQMLFSRVCELRATNWGQNEMLQTPTTYTQPNPYGSQGCSIYIPNMDDHMLEEQAADLPVFGEEEWNEYATDNISQEENPDEALYTQSYLEQYGYLPYATTDDWRSDEGDDYYDDFEKFLQGNNK